MIRCINIYCGTAQNITKHHLIPKPFRKYVIGKIGKVHLCEQCHKKVHEMKTITQLFLYYNTKQSIIELLASDVEFRVERLITVLNVENNYSRMVA